VDSLIIGYRSIIADMAIDEDKREVFASIYSIMFTYFFYYKLVIYIDTPTTKAAGVFCQGP
jgi:hypothetical protein